MNLHIDCDHTNPDLLIELLQQDRTQDLVLSPEDLWVVYGKTPTLDHFDDLVASVQVGDLEQFVGVLNTMKQQRNTMFGSFIDETKREHPEIAEGNIIFDDDGPFFPLLTKYFEDEFVLVNSDSLSYSAHLYLNPEKLQENTTAEVAKFFFGTAGSHHYTNANFDSLIQLEYALAMIEESKHPALAELNDLEIKYGIQLRVSANEKGKTQSPLTIEQIKVLDSALQAVKNLIPNDMKKVDSLTFLPASHRNGAEAQMRGSRTFYKNQIYFYGAFENNAPFSKVYPYGKDAREIASYGSTKDYIATILIHEIGHIVDIENNMTEKYSELGLWQEPWEVFAEDYRLYVMSQGEEILRRSSTGRKIPRYRARFTMMKELFASAAH